MKRWLMLPPLFLVGLLVALHASAAVRDADAKVELALVEAGQYRLGVENTGADPITSISFAAGPAFKLSKVDSATVGTCRMTNASSFSCDVMLGPPPCACRPGGNVSVLFSATGNPGGSSVKLNDSKTIPVGGDAPPPTATTTPPTTTQAPPAPKPKPKAKCKKGQTSTKKKPCRR